MRRIRPLVHAAAATTIVGALAVTLPQMTASATTGGPGVWVQLSSGSGVSTVHLPSVGRFGKELQVVWTQDGTSNNEHLRTRLVAANGSTASAIVNVLPAWSIFTDFPTVTPYAGGRLVSFSGQSDITTGDPYTDGAMYYATSSDGVSWTLGPGSTSHATSAGIYGSDAVNTPGGLVSVFSQSSDNDVQFHLGIDTANDPAAAADGTTTHISQCCSYQAGVAYDAASGKTWTIWYSNSQSSLSANGIDAQQIEPSLGSRLHAPSSSTTSLSKPASIQPNDAVPAVARQGGGVYTAYLIGYPTPTKIGIWRVGASKPHIIKTGHAVQDIGLVPGPGGKLWLYWWQQGSDHMHAVRSNASATAWGRVASFTTPHKTTDVWHAAGDGRNGRLDLVVNSGNGTGEQIFSTQVLPCLSASVSPSSVKQSTGGSVTIHVADAGAAVSGATVKYNGVTKTTNSHGNATFNVAKGTSTGKHGISFHKAGYTGGTVTFRVTS
jgi:hypothetical protein